MSAADSAILAHEVRTLLEAFSACVDAGTDVRGFFSDSAIFITPRGQLQGADAIANVFSGTARQRAESGRVSRHFVNAVTVSSAENGALNASSTLMAIAMEPNQDGAGAMLVANQTDVIVRDANGALRFERRETAPLMEFSLSSPKAQHT